MFKKNKIYIARHAAISGRARPRRQCGATLLEAIAFLGIAAFIMIGAASLFGTATTSANANNSITQVSAIRSTIRKLYQGTGAYTGLSNTVLVNSGGVPSTLTSTPAGVITNSYGGAVTVAPTAAPGSMFTISFAGIPQADCVQIAAGAGNNWTANGANASGVAINGVAVAAPVTASAVSGMCNGGAANTLVWTSS